MMFYVIKMAEKNSQQEMRHIVRIMNHDVQGHKPIVFAVTSIKGVGTPLANAICTMANIDPMQKAGLLADEELEIIESIIKDPVKHNIPSWLVNRTKDPDTGKDLHLSSSELVITHGNDLKMLRKTKSYRGLRLAEGLTVRGQRTRSNFRNKRKKSLGVQRKKK